MVHSCFSFVGKSKHGGDAPCRFVSAHEMSAVHSFIPLSWNDAPIQTLLLLIPVQDNSALATVAAWDAPPNKNISYIMEIKIWKWDAGISHQLK